MTNTKFSPDTKITLMGTEPWSAKILVEEAQKCNTLFARSCAKKIPEKSVQKILEHSQRSL